ncbi:MAG TPA: hypothetical protein VK611_04680 [Acidimicrobiales bacterium]|nr:hypothetical protein [Acidimicrobiales bacterium]
MTSGETAVAAPSTTSRPKKARWKAVLGLAALVGLMIAAFTSFDEVKDDLTNPVVLAEALGLHLVALVCGARAWVALFPPDADRRALARGIYLSQLTKYLPAGGFVQTASQVALSAEQGGLAVAALRLPVFSACFVAASTTLGSSLALDSDLPTWGRLLAGASLATVVVLDRRVLRWLLGVARRFVRRLPEGDALPPQEAILRCYAWALGNMAAFSIAFVVLLRDVADVGAVEAAAAMCLGWVVGYLALVVPGGLGVRETVLLATIPSLSLGTVAAVSAVHRLVGLVAEASLAGISQVRGRRHSSNSSSPGELRSR